MFHFIKKLFNAAPETDFKQIHQAGAAIIDVRSKEEFKSGHINGAINIPLNEITLRRAEIVKLKKPVITCCRSGARSSMANKQLISAGVESYNGGGWQSLQQKIKN